MTDTMPFGSLSISFDDRVLRPREWTAAQSEWAADLMATAPGGTVLELCAGAGHIGLLAVAKTGRRLLCVDANPVACDYARANALAAGLAELVEVREARLQEALAP
ncbi:MAG TPA: methyltransferase, partial [Nocardioides sp.]|nr:methyltransferase [Nocardioides sp.]